MAPKGGGYRMEYLIWLLSGLLTLTCAVRIGDHGVSYEGPAEVTEGDAFQITCELPSSDPALWTLNTSVPILEDNDLGYAVAEEEDGPFRRKATLAVRHTQLYQEGRYRCNRNSREFHYLRVIPAFTEEVHADNDADDDDDNDGKEDDDDDNDDEEFKRRSSYMYKLEVDETYLFNCTTSEDVDTPVTWYKNGARILQRSDSNVEIQGRTLVIENAREDDAGEYMCIVEPQYLEKYIGEGRIFRLITPAKIRDLPDIAELKKGERLELQCKIQGYPEPKIKWIIGNLLASYVSKKDKRVTLHDLTRSSSTLIFRNMTVEDGGLFTCRAENTIDPNDPQIDEESVYVHVRGVGWRDYKNLSGILRINQKLLAGKFNLI